jgi:hypothetical protein
MTLTTNDLLTVIAIPFIVSIIANLVTPTFRRWFAAGIAKSARTTNVIGLRLLVVRKKQIEKEIAEINEYADPKRATDLLDGALTFAKVSLWILLLSPLLGSTLRVLAPYLPDFLPSIYKLPEVAFALTVGSLAAAGPFQAAIYCSIVQRKLKKSRNATALIQRLNSEKADIIATLEQRQA